MANFTNETAVREKFQLTDTVRVTSALVTMSIDDAHTELLVVLDPMYDVAPANAGVILGETLLAGSRVLRSLASKDAFEQRHVSVGGSRSEEGKRHAALLKSAESFESRAWQLLRPFLRSVSGRVALDTTDTVALIEEN